MFWLRGGTPLKKLLGWDVSKSSGLPQRLPRRDAGPLNLPDLRRDVRAAGRNQHTGAIGVSMPSRASLRRKQPVLVRPKSSPIRLVGVDFPRAFFFQKSPALSAQLHALSCADFVSSLRLCVGARVLAVKLEERGKRPCR